MLAERVGCSLSVAIRLPDARGNKRCGTGGCLGEDDSKLIATISRGRINRPAKQTEHSAKAAQCPAACQVAVAVIALLQPIQVQQQNSKRPSRAPRSFDLRTEDVQDPTIVAKAGKGIGNGQESCLRFHSFTLGQVESRE